MNEMPSAYRLVKRKARKNHKCCECRGIIQSGETYNYHSGIWDGEPSSYKVCFDCEQLRNRVGTDFDLRYDEYPGLGDLANDLEQEHLKDFLLIQEKRKLMGVLKC